jgi:hypothetical protein
MSDLWKRGGGGGGGAGGGAASVGAQGAAADVLEKQNEEALGSLQAKIAAMKNVSASTTPRLHTDTQTQTQTQTHTHTHDRTPCVPGLALSRLFCSKIKRWPST